MARIVRDKNLGSREARSKLPRQKKPHWRSIEQGLHLGYYKGARGGAWVARRFTGNGSYKEHKLGIADDATDADGVAVLSYAQAVAAARDWFKAAIHAEVGHVVAGPYTVADAMRDYLAWYAIHRKALADTKRVAEAHILPALGHIEVAKLTRKKIRDWHAALAAAPARLRTSRNSEQKHRAASDDPEYRRKRRATANRILTVLKAALNHAWKEGKVATDEPWRSVKPFREVDAPVERYLTEAECVRLVNACAPDFRQLVRAALLTGCRYGELKALKVADFNPDAGTLFVRSSKAGKARHVVLTAEGQEFFSITTAGRSSGETMFLRADGQPWGKSHQIRPMQDACRAAGITPAVSFHILRHTHGSTLAMRGVPMRVIAEQLGHADTRMTERHYAHLAPSYKADTIRANFPSLGIVERGNVATLTPNTR